MSSKSSRSESTKKSFAQFVSELPSAAEVMSEQTITLTGSVLRSDKEGMFVLSMADGQTIDLNTDAVKNYQVTSGEREVQLEVLVNRLPGDLSARTLPTLDRYGTLKEVITDASADFTLANLDTIKEPTTDNITDATLKEPVKDPIYETFKEPNLDTVKEANYDTVKEPNLDPNTFYEPTGTLQEGLGGIEQGGGVINPAQMGNAGLTPFIMATPHHAATAPQMMQMMARSLNLNTIPGQESATLTLKETNQDVHTFKEVGKDPIFDTLKEANKDPIYDTLKEVVGDPNTFFEPTGSLQEGLGGLQGGVNPPVWNMPGLMF